MRPNTKVYLGVGSNQGNRLENCREALRRISKIPGIQLLRTSHSYETQPVGNGFSQWFVNGVAEIETDLDPRSLLQRLQGVEREMGRQRGSGQGDRQIDLDLLLYDDLLWEEDDLIVPHPFLHHRRFVLEPLRELVPLKLHPRLKRTVEELWRELQDLHRVKRMEFQL